MVAFRLTGTGIPPRYAATARPQTTAEAHIQPTPTGKVIVDTTAGEIEVSSADSKPS